jgi:hypothetical protein
VLAQGVFNGWWKLIKIYGGTTMKRVLSTIVTALVALAFAGLVSAADMPNTDTQSPNAEPEASMKGDTSAKPMKKAKKKKKKAKKARKMNMGDTGSTSPSTSPASPTGTTPEGSPVTAPGAK